MGVEARASRSQPSRALLAVEEGQTDRGHRSGGRVPYDAAQGAQMAGEGPAPPEKSRSWLRAKEVLGVGRAWLCPVWLTWSPGSPQASSLGQAVPGGPGMAGQTFKGPWASENGCERARWLICGGDQKSEARRPARLLR